MPLSEQLPIVIWIGRAVNSVFGQILRVMEMLHINCYTGNLALPNISTLTLWSAYIRQYTHACVTTITHTHTHTHTHTRTHTHMDTYIYCICRFMKELKVATLTMRRSLVKWTDTGRIYHCHMRRNWILWK